MPIVNFETVRALAVVAIRADMIVVGETSRLTCRCSRTMTRAAASGWSLDGASSQGSDHEPITC